MSEPEALSREEQELLVDAVQVAMAEARNMQRLLGPASWMSPELAATCERNASKFTAEVDRLSDLYRRLCATGVKVSLHQRSA